MRNPVSMKHNKRRNVGIVYEMLVRCVSEAMLDEDHRRSNSAVRLMKRYFGRGQPLATELAIHQAIMSRRGVSAPLARKIIAEAMSAASRIDRRLCEIKKSNLIKDLNYGFGRDFFDRYRIPEYRALASVHMLIQSAGVAKTLSEKVDRATLEESIIEFMRSEARAPRSLPAEERNALTFRLANEEFGRTFGKDLLPAQSKLLEAYGAAALGGDRAEFKRLAEQARLDGVAAMSAYSVTKECASDPVLLERTRVVVETLRSMKISLDEACLEDLMAAQGMANHTRTE